MLALALCARRRLLAGYGSDGEQPLTTRQPTETAAAPYSLSPAHPRMFAATHLAAGRLHPLKSDQGIYAAAATAIYHGGDVVIDVVLVHGLVEHPGVCVVDVAEAWIEEDPI